VTFTDTNENWAQTVDHCGNILDSEEIGETTTTRTYALWADAEINSVTFYRPSDLADPDGSIGAYASNEWTRPDDAPDANCADNLG